MAKLKLSKMAKFSFEQIKEMLAIHENTSMKFSTSSMERLENKIERLSNENTLLKQEVESLKIGATDFRNKWFEEAKRDFEEMKARNPIEEDGDRSWRIDLGERGDRSRWNNLRHSEFTEKTKGAKAWEESENLLREFIEENLEIGSKGMKLLNYVPYLLSCPTCLGLYVLLYLTCLVLYVLSCLVPYLLWFFTLLVPYVPPALPALLLHVPHTLHALLLTTIISNLYKRNVITEGVYI